MVLYVVQTKKNASPQEKQRKNDKKKQTNVFCHIPGRLDEKKKTKKRRKPPTRLEYQPHQSPRSAEIRQASELNCNCFTRRTDRSDRSRSRSSRSQPAPGSVRYRSDPGKNRCYDRPYRLYGSYPETRAGSCRSGLYLSCLADRDHELPVGIDYLSDL